jgi:hypothetical protein
MPRFSLDHEHRSVSNGTYAVGDTVTTTLVITNAGDATATNVRALGGDEDGLDRTGTFYTEPFDLAPGESRAIAVDGVLNEVAYWQGYASGMYAYTNDAGEANPDDNYGRFRIDLPPATGDLRIEVFIDVRGDMSSDQPPLAGAEVVVTDPESGDRVAAGRTDGSGVVTFTGLAAKFYALSVTCWKLRGDDPASTPVEVTPHSEGQVSLAVIPRRTPRR